MQKNLWFFLILIFLLLPLACNYPSASQTAQSPQNASAQAIRATLCWVGPGSAYPVVSGIKKNERVALLGRGSISGWWIVRNPIYRDPCWVQASDLQVDLGFDTARLKVVTPPPTPTPTDIPTPTATLVP